MENSVEQSVQELTGGRDFVFVIMAYEHAQATMLFERIKRIIENKFGLACLRADDVKYSGHALLDKIHEIIDRASLVIAEISERAPNDFSPNVYYEVGYTVGRGKRPILLAQSDTKIPTDLLGQESVRYGNSIADLEKFDREFEQHLKLRMESSIGLLRDMLLPESPTPSLIVASPKYPGQNSNIQGQRYDRRTFGDNLGIVGLLSAFGKFAFEMQSPDLVSADFHYPELEEDSVNLFLIGSKKSNSLAGIMLHRIQENRKGPDWYLGREPKSEENDDYIVKLYGAPKGYRSLIEGSKGPFGENESEVHTEDYGIIVRAPHPDHSDRVVLILAGAHSLGTGAACIAATCSQKIKEIRLRLGTDNDALSDKQAALWVLVKGTSGKDGMLGESDVEIVEAGVYGEVGTKE